MKNIENMTGATGTASAAVNEKNTALAVGSGSLEVFATPMLLALLEKASVNAVAQFLEENETTVGTNADIAHTSATPVGLEVTAKAEIIAVNGREITLTVTACDKNGSIGRGTHKRFVVKADKFMEKTKAKLL